MFSAQELTLMSFKEEFVHALHLLHSTEPGSAEELRALLDASIVKRYGSEKTTFAKLSDSDLSCEQDEESDSHEDSENVEEYESNRRLTSGLFIDSGENDVGGKDEVPRISIPDEDQNDGVVCKVCNVPEFGPLILIQCRECGELYHPLCHLPPIVDARVNDPDFLWQCNECEANTLLQDDSKKLFKNSQWIRGDEIK